MAFERPGRVRNFNFATPIEPPDVLNKDLWGSSVPSGCAQGRLKQSHFSLKSRFEIDNLSLRELQVVFERPKRVWHCIFATLISDN